MKITIEIDVESLDKNLFGEMDKEEQMYIIESIIGLDGKINDMNNSIIEVLCHIKEANNGNDIFSVKRYTEELNWKRNNIKRLKELKRCIKIETMVG